MSIDTVPMVPRYGLVDRDYGLRLATTAPEADGPVHMCNLMKYRARADYGDESGGGISGREADDRYAPVDVLRAIGAAVCFTADVVEASEDWDRVGVVRYPTRRSFIDMQRRDDFREKHVHKDAGMDHTIVLGTVPVAGLPGAGAGALVVLELWTYAAPPSPPAGVATAGAAAFTVEGTIVGDGRRWTGCRYGIATGPVDLASATPDHQILVLRPTIERWR